ncbi:MAG: flagellar basal body L-ring protein FlgH [Gemmatimonadaceae bacterium]|nr:flagellar basal body L-ring protein FlgH [Gemmatimonadaceae bacterium]
MLSIDTRLWIIAMLLYVAIPASVTAQATANAARRSWTSDRIQLAVGDVVTVFIDEQTLAAANLREDASDNRGRVMSAGAQMPDGSAMGAGMSADKAVDSRRSGQSVRGNSFRAEVSARVVAISPTGMLQLEGQKELFVDKAKQTIILSGWVRPNDIAVATNSVDSWRMADAKIEYKQKGRLGKARGGLIGKIFGAIWP